MVKFKLRMKKLRRVATVYGVAAVMLSSLLGVGTPAQTSELPTWDEIRAAKGNEAATANRIGEVEGLLRDFRQQAGLVGDQAVQAESTLHAAEDALKSSQRRLLLLQEKHSNALLLSEELKHRAGGIAAQAYKTGSTSPGVLLLLDANHAVEAANRLVMTNIVGGRTNELYAEADASARVAQVLHEQQESVLAAIEDQSQEAAKALEAAQSMDQRARRSVAKQEESSSLLYEQLAELKGTTAQLESSRIRGLAAQASYREQQDAARQAVRADNELEETRNDGAGDRPAVATNPAPGISGTPAPDGRSPEKPKAPVPPPAPEQSSPPAPSPEPSRPAPRPPTPAPSPPPEADIVDNPAAAQAYAESRMAAFSWNNGQFRCLVNLWNRESRWRTSAQNSSSGAYGIPQSLPGSKMASAGADWRTNYRTQIEWGLGYVSGRYGSPCAAWDHSESHGWY
ncbi:lytic transglycosylase domain-containing protein [Arthrobacter roseus]|uniref:aggregation-promoting factor C-terminal-like domain-containing protein n=1 Tax=Arthrobacter roseus TaxID=136274 RepID=UPI0019650EBE|nr:lytic transglycosylase domain-containing protein [Arthrobacter roseus]MBM7848241.1 outer membrane biosynthesis protein TonB [Arthrobacter roseus]